VIEAFSPELQGFACTNVLDIVGWRAALLVALLVEAAIRATCRVNTAASGASDYGSEGWGFESLRACHRNSCTARLLLFDGFLIMNSQAAFLVEFLVETHIHAICERHHGSGGRT
jgi:hypothetical protein